MSDLKIFTENIEPKALDQIYTLIKQPAFTDCKVRIMPDVHAGAGCVIGFTARLLAVTVQAVCSVAMVVTLRNRVTVDSFG
jgi:RNA-splicing ligase RtcB